MPIEKYGVWVAKPVRVTAERAAEDPETPHAHLFYDDGTGGQFDHARRASINVKSLSALSELVFWLVPDLQHPILDALRGLTMGFNRVPSQPGGAALDYIRGNLMDLRAGRVLPHDLPGTHNDIIDFILPEFQAAISRNATVYLYGEPYSDMQGIHDVHANQGSQGRFRKYNGVWQDGGVITYFPDEDRFAALFLAFASQAIHTDEVNGHPLPGSQNLAGLLGRPTDDDDILIADDRRIAIVAALVNPESNENQPGSADERPEMVYLLNRTTQAISLHGWSLLNKHDEVHRITSDIRLDRGEVRTVTMGQIPLSNQGGLITLLDENGNKVDGVSYTKEQAGKEGEVIIFR